MMTAPNTGTNGKTYKPNGFICAATVKQNFFLFLWGGAFKKKNINKVLNLFIKRGNQYVPENN